MRISEKSLSELEFPVIRTRLAELCHFEYSRKLASNISPIKKVGLHSSETAISKELLNGLYADVSLPSFVVAEIAQGLAKLLIENYQLPAAHFLAFLDTVKTVKSLQLYLKKNQEFFPLLFERISELGYEEEVAEEIERVFDSKGEVRSNASAELQDIRISLQQKQQEYQRLFQQALQQAASQQALGETREGLWDGKRVMSVLSEHKRQVKGRILGFSNSGKLTYMEPEATIQCSNDIVLLENLELKEISKILLGLAALLRPHYDFIKNCHYFLSWLDFNYAKAKLGVQMQGLYPPVNYKSTDLELKQAFHPTLLFKHGRKEVVAHDMQLHKQQRYLVISGPNAGGKSISLKTLGLLQVMYQAGLPIPVHESSKMGWFGSVFTDIGDNQSVDNELSTYSYRLKQMRLFLERSDAKSLILIDEFGSGSDPELGGALAEACLKALYELRGKAVITTHYGNIKVLVDKLPEAINASMLFDQDTLSPTYKLSIGTAGSSFTFEVAEKMGLKKGLIKEAMQLIDQDKLNLDKSLSKVQQYERELEEMRKIFSEARLSKDQATKDLELRSQYFEQQYQQLQDLQQRNDKQLQLGKKLESFINRYNQGNKEAWIKEFERFVLVERSKNAPKPELKKEKKSSSKPDKKPNKSPKESRLLSKAKQEIKVKEEPKIEKPIEVGSRVRILDSSSKGTVVEIRKQKAMVDVGGLITQVALKNLTAI